MENFRGKITRMWIASGRAADETIPRRSAKRTERRAERRRESWRNEERLPYLPASDRYTEVPLFDYPLVGIITSSWRSRCASARATRPSLRRTSTWSTPTRALEHIVYSIYILIGPYSRGSKRNPSIVERSSTIFIDSSLLRSPPLSVLRQIALFVFRLSFALCVKGAPTSTSTFFDLARTPSRAERFLFLSPWDSRLNFVLLSFPFCARLLYDCLPISSRDLLFSSSIYPPTSISKRSFVLSLWRCLLSKRRHI